MVSFNYLSVTFQHYLCQGGVCFWSEKKYWMDYYSVILWVREEYVIHFCRSRSESRSRNILPLSLTLWDILFLLHIHKFPQDSWILMEIIWHFKGTDFYKCEQFGSAWLILRGLLGLGGGICSMSAIPVKIWILGDSVHADKMFHLSFL